jgi:hypothetical protein
MLTGQINCRIQCLGLAYSFSSLDHTCWRFHLHQAKDERVSFVFQIENGRKDICKSIKRKLCHKGNLKMVLLALFGATMGKVLFGTQANSMHNHLLKTFVK